MKISKQRLRQIIKEEIEAEMNEALSDEELKTKCANLKKERSETAQQIPVNASQDDPQVQYMMDVLDNLDKQIKDMKCDAVDSMKNTQSTASKAPERKKQQGFTPDEMQSMYDYYSGLRGGQGG